MDPVVDPASSPLADAVSWLLDRLIEGELTDDQVRARFTNEVDLSAQRGTFSALRRPIRSIDTYEEVNARFARVGVTDDKGRPMTVRVGVTDSHPARIHRWTRISPDRQV